MAETVHLRLKANGTDIQGESTQTTSGKANTIECIFLDHSVQTPVATRLTTGRRQYAPLLIRKRIDKATPLLMKAMIENQIIEATFLFYRPNPTGDGTTEQFYTIAIKNGRISSMRNYLPDTLTAETAKLPPLEEVTFIFQNIQWTYAHGGVTFQDSVEMK